MPPRDASALLARAVDEWNRGDHYEAHETLEDFADAFEESGSDDERTWALGLVRAAACLHKWVHDVGRSAVPGKLKGALVDSAGAPDVWQGLDVARLRAELTAWERALEGGTNAAPPNLWRVGIS